VGEALQIWCRAARQQHRRRTATFPGSRRETSGCSAERTLDPIATLARRGLIAADRSGHPACGAKLIDAAMRGAYSRMIV
jgi:hypothetical protein